MKNWNWPSLAVGGPAIVLAAGLGVALVATALGRSPIWPDQHVNLSEAIAAHDDAEVERLIAAGADVNASFEVRAPLTFDRASRVTPLEAAALSGRGDLIDRLVKAGARLR